MLRGDARCLPLPDASVDLIVTSPPYFALRSYQDGGKHYAGQVGDEATPADFLASLWACTAEWMRVLKPSGSLWVNLGDKYAQNTERSRNGHGGSLVGTDPLRDGPVYSGRRDNGVRTKSLLGVPWRYALGCIDQLGLILRAEVIWSKPNSLPESVTDRVRRSHETWFHFTKQPRYFSAVDEVRETYSDRVQERQKYAGRDIPRRAWSEDSGRADGNGERGILGFGHQGAHPLGKLPGSVWDIATQPLTVPTSLGVDHFAAFPMEWPRRIIRGWSPSSGVVLDPFGGTGTTALVASSLGRVGISVDLSHDYSRLARWRTTDPAQRAAAMQVEKPPQQVDGQADLFGDVA